MEIAKETSESVWIIS